MTNIAQLVEAAHAQSTKSGFWSHDEACRLPAWQQTEGHGGSPPECHCVNLDIDMKIVLIHSELSETLEEYRLTEDQHGGKLNEILYEYAGGRQDGETVLLSCPTCREVAAATSQKVVIPGPHKGHWHKPVGFMAELADVAIRIFDLTGHLRRGSMLQGQFETRYHHERPAQRFAASLKEAHRLVSSAGLWMNERIDPDECVTTLARVLIELEYIVTMTTDPRGDLDEAIRIKMAFNATRPFKHGKTC